MSGLAAVLAEHRADMWSCSCGWPLNDSVGSLTTHLEGVVLAWLGTALQAPKVVEAAQRARDDDPMFAGSMVIALAAAIEALTTTETP